MNSQSTTSNVKVRKAEMVDAPVVKRLILALAEYEKLEPPSPEALDRLVGDAFADRPRIDIYLAETGPGAAVGYAIVLETYSSFKGLPTLYLEDIFVLSDARGCGAGFALFREVVREAERRGCGRVEFMVLEWNTLAREFYKKLGAEHLDDWLPYRLTADKFGAITGSES